MKRRCSKNKAALKNFSIIAAKQLCWGLFLNNNACLQACNFIKKKLYLREISEHYFEEHL